MKSKWVYVGAVLLSLLAVLGIAKFIEPENVRVQQHLSYNTEVEDTNLSIEPSSFSSHLPVVSIETEGQTIPGRPETGQKVSQVKNTFIRAEMKIIENQGELNTLKDTPQIESDIQIRVRGNSSRRFDKAGYLFKFIDEDGMDQGYEVMGMEKDSTWVLHGPFLDKTLMRNYMWYNLSGQIMEWAPDVRFCEVFLNGGYQGVYVMEEQISVGEGRIEVTEYDGKSNMSSYIVCVDRESVNDVDYLDNFTEYTRRMTSKVEVKYPGAKKLTPEITDHISRDFSKFEKSLYSYDYKSKRYGYGDFIDIDNFVDYYIINEVTQNTDAGIYSTYFYKDITGKLKMSVWDFNNCCDNYMEYQQSMAGFFMQNRTWFFMLSKDEKFTGKVIDRYRQLRKGILSDDNVKTYMPEVQEYLGCAIDRNFQVWGYTFEAQNDLLQGEGRQIGSYEEAVEQYEKRLVSRMGWLDKHIDALYSYSHESVNKKFND